MGIATWQWLDVSPEDGCSLVNYLAAAESLQELAHIAARNKVAQRRTARRLLIDGGARRTSDAEAQIALAQPGALFWRASETSEWARISG